MGNEKIGIRGGTREKIEAIRTARRWTYTETIDALCDFYLEKHPGIEVTDDDDHDDSA